MAACLVVLYHYFQDSPGFGLAFRVIKHGYIGVDLFFILSGFVMALTYGHFFKLRFSVKTYLAFLCKRLGRVYPLYFCVTAAVAACVSLQIMTGDGLSAPTLASNFALVQAWGLAPSIGGPTWSISTEFAAYLAFPALVAVVLVGRAYAAILAAITALLILLVLTQLDTANLNQVYDGIPSRSGPLDIAGTYTVFPLLRCLAGFVLGLVAFRVFRDHAGLRIITARRSGDLAAFIVLLLLLFRSSDIGLEVAFMGLVITLASSRSWVAAAMENKCVFWLGEISYSIYLVHKPVESLLRNPLIAVLNRYHVPHSYTLAALPPLLLVIPISALTFYGIEKPARDWSRRLMGMNSSPPIAIEPSAP